MPRESVNFSGIHKICKLVVLLCFLHISVTLIFYVRSFDIRLSFMQNQQSAIRRDATAGPHAASTVGVIAAATEGGLSAATAVSPEESRGGNSSTKQAGATGDHRPQTSAHPTCPTTSPLLVGPLQIEFKTPVSLEMVAKDNRDVRPGGRYTPGNCVALEKVAIIIPFRNREEHLTFWLHYLHPILQRQQLDYGIYVINQDGMETFNRAKLLNVGYAEAVKDYDYGCFVFSDVDLIPMDDRNIYKCFSQPRHLSVSMDKFGFSCREPLPRG